MSLGFSFAINLTSLPKNPIVKYYYLISIGVLHIVNLYSCHLQYAISTPQLCLFMLRYKVIMGPLFITLDYATKLAFAQGG